MELLPNNKQMRFQRLKYNIHRPKRERKYAKCLTLQTNPPTTPRRVVQRCLANLDPAFGYRHAVLAKHIPS